jgi:hypothetical protein
MQEGMCRFCTYTTFHVRELSIMDLVSMGSWHLLPWVLKNDCNYLHTLSSQNYLPYFLYMGPVLGLLSKSLGPDAPFLCSLVLKASGKQRHKCDYCCKKLLPQFPPRVGPSKTMCQLSQSIRLSPSHSFQNHKEDSFYFEIWIASHVCFTRNR